MKSSVLRPSDQGWLPASGIRRLAAGFTLLEVMLVIGIIAIMAGLLFPVVIGASKRAREKQAAAETRTILMAIKAYRQEYGKWPNQTQATQDTTYITNNYLVIQPLLGSNVKDKIFLHLQVNTNVNPDYAGNYLDPWGIPYVICMDENEDNQMSISMNGVSYAASNQVLGATNIFIYVLFTEPAPSTSTYPTNYVAKVDAGVASLGGTSNDITKWNSWTEIL